MVETQHRSFLLEATTESFLPSARHRLKLERTNPDAWQRSKELWCGVGLGFWTARSRWTESRWRQHLGEPAVSFWVAMRRGQDIGFFELVAQRRGIKIEGFGLVPSQRGRGFGSALLSLATVEAFSGQNVLVISYHGEWQSEDLRMPASHGLTGYRFQRIETEHPHRPIRFTMLPPPKDGEALQIAELGGCKEAA